MRESFGTLKMQLDALVYDSLPVDAVGDRILLRNCSRSDYEYLMEYLEDNTNLNLPRAPLVFWDGTITMSETPSPCHETVASSVANCITDINMRLTGCFKRPLFESRSAFYSISQTRVVEPDTSFKRRLRTSASLGVETAYCQSLPALIQKIQRSLQYPNIRYTLGIKIDNLPNTGTRTCAMLAMLFQKDTNNNVAPIRFISFGTEAFDAVKLLNDINEHFSGYPINPIGVEFGHVPCSAPDIPEYRIYFDPNLLFQVNNDEVTPFATLPNINLAQETYIDLYHIQWETMREFYVSGLFPGDIPEKYQFEESVLSAESSNLDNL